MESLVYANRVASEKSPLYSQVRSIKKIVYDSPLTQRIIFEKGEIVLNVSGNQLNLYTRQYLPEGNFQITSRIHKYVPGNNALEMLDRAKRDIVQRVTDLEMKTHYNNLDQKVRNYIQEQWVANERKLREKVGSLSLEQLEYLKKLAYSFKVAA